MCTDYPEIKSLCAAWKYKEDLNFYIFKCLCPPHKSLHAVDTTRMTVKCTKIRNARTKKLLFFIVKFAKYRRQGLAPRSLYDSFDACVFLMRLMQ